MRFDGVVDHPHLAPFTDGAEGQFGLKRHPELAHHQDVKRRPQRLGDLERHRHPAARQAQHDYVLAVQRLQTLGQLTPCIATIVELCHCLSVSRYVGAPKGRMATPVGTKASRPHCAESHPPSKQEGRRLVWSQDASGSRAQCRRVPSSWVTVRWAAHEATMFNVRVTPHVRLKPARGWPAAPIPAELHQRHGEEARKVIVDAIEVADDNVQEGDRPEIDRALLCLINQSARHLQLVVVGSDDVGGSAGLLLGSASTDVVPTACIPVIVAGQH